MTRLNYLFASCVLIFLALSCQDKKEIKPMPTSVEAYILAYDEGVIGRKDAINIQFAGLVVEAEKIGTTAAGKTFTISPSVAGQWEWIDRQQVKFTPDKPLDFSTKYIVSTKLTDLFINVPPEAAVFEFGVQTRDPFLSIKTDGLSTPDVQQREKQVLKGKLKTSDFIAQSTAKDMLSVRQDGKELPITWSANAAGMEYTFTVSNIARSTKASAVLVNWNGSTMGAEQKGTTTVEVPALGDFKVDDVQTFGGSNPHVSIHFSDPLDEGQQFDGLVSIDNHSGSLNYQARGHFLEVYLNENIVGDNKVKVFAGIKNLYKDPMPKASFWDVNFTTVDPEVRLLGHGNILPSSGQLVFPFEAKGLHTVEVEVFKIFSNNILQFMQTNSFDGRDEMKRVGKIIYRGAVKLEEISPDANQLSWSSYALDLKELFAADAKAIYQIRIGFRPTHSVSSCGSSQDFEFVDERWNRSEDLLDSWYGIEGYYEDYRWDQRDDPCYPAYYNSDRFIFRNVLTSNIGLLAKVGTDNHYHAAVSDLRTTKPLAGVTLKYYDFQQQLLTSTTSDANGFAVVQLEERPFFVLAETENDQAYLRLQDAEALSLSRFDVAGTNTKEGLKGFIYGERGVWRPGDSLFLNFVLEDEKGLLPPDYPIALELRDARGQLVENRKGILPEGLIYPLHLSTQQGAPTGLWEVKVRVGNAQFKKNIRLETVKPNRIKMD
ncbi:MAG: MG2 domain-containing protein, partial [Bacteroidota bacterium]